MFPFNIKKNIKTKKCDVESKKNFFYLKKDL